MTDKHRFGFSLSREYPDEIKQKQYQYFKAQVGEKLLNALYETTLPATIDFEERVYEDSFLNETYEWDFMITPVEFHRISMTRSYQDDLFAYVPEKKKLTFKQRLNVLFTGNY